MQTVLHRFSAELRDHGLMGAMRWLNASVPYRYSAIFAFRGDTLENICLVDKADPGVTTCGDQQIAESYCLYIRRTEALFELANAANDDRVTGHPKRESFLSYYGVPLFADDGALLGTVCHFDQSAMKPPTFMAEALDDLAQVIAQAAF